MRSSIRAIRYLHNKNVCHRDIKMSNILISHENFYKIGDLGWALDTNEETPLAFDGGDELYMAPELLGNLNRKIHVGEWK